MGGSSSHKEVKGHKLMVQVGGPLWSCALLTFPYFTRFSVDFILLVGLLRLPCGIKWK